MIDELKKLYKQSDHFFFKLDDNLSNVCNAPINKSGVYIVYQLTRGRIELVYIGRSGKKDADGAIKHRKAGLGGIKDRIVNGHQFGKIPRRKSWPAKMKEENIDALDIYWFVTHNENIKHFPEDVENELLQVHVEIFGRLPKWNKK